LEGQDGAYILRKSDRGAFSTQLADTYFLLDDLYYIFRFRYDNHNKEGWHYRYVPTLLFSSAGYGLTRYLFHKPSRKGNNADCTKGDILFYLFRENPP
jgi:hypothetical protein